MTERQQVGWFPVLQVLLSLVLAGIAAYGGVQAGQAESRASTTALSSRLDSQEAQMVRLEDKIDWLIRHEVEKGDRK